MLGLKSSLSSRCLCKMYTHTITASKLHIHLELKSCVAFQFILSSTDRPMKFSFFLSLLFLFQLLAYLLKRKTQLLNNRILQLIFSLVGTAELGFESSVIKNYNAFQYVLCNFEVKLLMLV